MCHRGKLNYSSVLALILFLGIANTPVFSQTDPVNLALVVAISDYPESSGWQKLNAKNDLLLMRETLLDVGFSEENIYSLRDGDASRTGILNAVREKLLEQSGPGSIVYFHFSGHGQQIMDDNGDELDGYDEAIVPVNSPQAYRPGIYEGQNLIRDEELGELFLMIRKKIGPNGLLHVVLDACHSGTGTRGLAVARGSYIKMAPDGYQQDQDDDIRDTKFFHGELESAGEDLAPMVAFFGAAHNQLNFETTDDEGRNVGSLTYSLSKSLGDIDRSTSYRVLFEKIKIEMNKVAPMQYPQAEGDLDIEVMSGKYVGKSSHFLIKQWNDPGSVTLEAGWLQGIHEGTEMGFYPLDTRNPEASKMVTKGTVIWSEANVCGVELEQDLSQQEITEVWAIIHKKGFEKQKVSIKLEMNQDEPLFAAVNEVFRKNALRVVTENADLILRKDKDSVELVTSRDESLLALSVPVGADYGTLGDIASIALTGVNRYSQSRFLKSIEINSPNLQVWFEIVPVEYDSRSRKVLRELTLDTKKDASGQIIFRKGDVLKIRVHNDGMKPAYFSLLDFQPDYKINVLIPSIGETPAEYLIPPGRSLDVPNLIGIQPPYGRELFKLIATDKPVDLRPLAQAHRISTRGQQTGLEELFNSAIFDNSVNTRGGGPVTVPVEEVSMFSILFDIKP